STSRFERARLRPRRFRAIENRGLKRWEKMERTFQVPEGMTEFSRTPFSPWGDNISNRLSLCDFSTNIRLRTPAEMETTPYNNHSADARLFGCCCLKCILCR